MRKSLEIGGGPVNWTTSMMRPRAREIVGLDIDPAVKANEFLDDAVVSDGDQVFHSQTHGSISQSRDR